MEESKTPHTVKPRPRKVDRYNALQVKNLFVSMGLFAACLFGPISGSVILISLIVDRTPLTVEPKWMPVIIVLACILVVPLYRLRQRIRRQRQELEDQLG